MKDVELIGMLKTFINETLVGMGALKGAACQIQDISSVPGGNKITFLWKDTDDVSHTTELTVLNGSTGNGISSISKTSTEGLVDTYTITYTDGNTTTFEVTNGSKGDPGSDGVGIYSIEKTSTSGLVDTYTITLTNGIEATFTVTNGAKGDPGDDGFSPVIVEDPDNTDDIYKLDITTSSGTFVTPNLKGGGSGGTTNYNSLDNKPKINNVELSGNKTSADLGIKEIETIKVNGVTQTITNKSVDLDVASNLITEAQWTQIQALLV